MVWFLIPLGIVIIVYAERIAQVTGDIAFAEYYFGRGGTYGFIKLMGLALSILSIMFATGGLQAFIQRTVGTVF